jgi:hypothetical protein
MIKDEYLEPFDHNFERDGLWTDWVKSKPIKKNEIDIALRKLFGKDSHKPTGATRWDFRKK